MGFGCGLPGPHSITISTKKSKAEALCAVGPDLMSKNLSGRKHKASGPGMKILNTGGQILRLVSIGSSYLASRLWA